MGWYDFFSRFYDNSLEHHYVEQRMLATAAAELEPGHVVLDVPCGTGQSFDAIAPAIGREGKLVGIDVSRGMLAKAKLRAERNDWPQVVLGRHDVREIDAEVLKSLGISEGEVDRLHVFLGLSAFPDWEASFERLWGLLAPKGRAIVVDVYAEKPDFQGKMVNLVARADIRRRTWEALERLGSNFEKRDLPSTKEHGGQLYVATATKPQS